jgi:hypothetical protein
MSVTFVAAGALAGNATVATQAIAQPTCAVGDILICAIINKSVTANVVSPPDGSWTAVIATEVNDCTTAADDHQFSLFWKIATATTGNHTFTKATDDNVLFAGVMVAYRGTASTPLDATPAARTKTAGASDNVSFPAYDPTSTDVRVIFVAYYGNDATTFAAAMSNDVNPDCTIDVDVESGTGNDCSIAITSGLNDGSNVAARTWASSSTIDAGNTGVVFALVSLRNIVFGVDPAVYNFTTAAATFLRGIKLVGTNAVYAFTTAAANIIAQRKLVVTNAAYSFTESTVTFVKGFRFGVDEAVYSFTPADVTFRVTKIFHVDPAVYSFDAAGAAVLVQRKLSVEEASYSFSTEDATIKAGRKLVVDNAVYSITTADAGIRAQRRLNVQEATYSFSTADASILRGYHFSVTEAVYSFNTADTGITKQSKLVVQEATYNFTEESAGLKAQRKLPATNAVYLFTTEDAGLVFSGGGVVFGVDPASYIFSTGDAGLTVQRRLSVSNAVYLFTTPSVSFSITTSEVLVLKSKVRSSGVVVAAIAEGTKISKVKEMVLRKSEINE